MSEFQNKPFGDAKWRPIENCMIQFLMRNYYGLGSYKFRFGNYEFEVILEGGLMKRQIVEEVLRQIRVPDDVVFEIFSTSVVDVEISSDFFTTVQTKLVNACIALTPMRRYGDTVESAVQQNIAGYAIEAIANAQKEYTVSLVDVDSTPLDNFASARRFLTTFYYDGVFYGPCAHIPARSSVGKAFKIAFSTPVVDTDHAICYLPDNIVVENKEIKQPEFLVGNQAVRFFFSHQGVVKEAQVSLRFGFEKPVAATTVAGCMMLASMYDSDLVLDDTIETIRNIIGKDISADVSQRVVRCALIERDGLLHCESLDNLFAFVSKSTKLPRRFNILTRLRVIDGDLCVIGFNKIAYRIYDQLDGDKYSNLTSCVLLSFINACVRTSFENGNQFDMSSMLGMSTKLLLDVFMMPGFLAPESNEIDITLSREFDDPKTFFVTDFDSRTDIAYRVSRKKIKAETELQALSGKYVEMQLLNPRGISHAVTVKLDRMDGAYYESLGRSGVIVYDPSDSEMVGRRISEDELLKAISDSKISVAEIELGKILPNSMIALADDVKGVTIYG